MASEMFAIPFEEKRDPSLFPLFGALCQKPQVEFIRELYRVLLTYRKQIEYASFFCLFDDDPDFMKQVYRVSFPEVSDSYLTKLTSAVSKFGLFERNGTPKLGWNEFQRQVVDYYRQHDVH